MADMATPEDKSCEQIDKALSKAGWNVQDMKAANLNAGRGVAFRNFPLASGYGFADYLLYIDGKAVGVIEAKKEGFPLVGVEVQAVKYSEGLPSALPAYIRPLPFLYKSTGVEPALPTGLILNHAAGGCLASIVRAPWQNGWKGQTSKRMTASATMWWR